MPTTARIGYLLRGDANAGLVFFAPMPVGMGHGGATNESLTQEAEIRDISGDEETTNVNDMRQQVEEKSKLQTALRARSSLSAELTTNVKRDVFSLDEGQVVVQWPATAAISAESFEDFKEWIDLVVKRIGRTVKKETPTDE